MLVTKFADVKGISNRSLKLKEFSLHFLLQLKVNSLQKGFTIKEFES